MDGRVVVDLAGRLLAFGERERAADLVAELRHRPSVDLDERRSNSLTLIERWLDRRSASVPTGSVPVAVMDYQTPDHVLTSGNLGDYIQTMAMVGNLVRLTSVAFSGDDGLGELASELQERVQPRLRLPDVSGSVHLVAVDRDFSSASDVPVATWMVAFGWHMHPLFDLRYDFPYHPNVRPLFISFHVNRLEMLTDAARAYLRQYGPVGCRDWTTVFLLLSAGIDAFFTGCLTTTIDALFPAREQAYHGKGAVGAIDLPGHSVGGGARNVRVYSHQSDEVRYMSVTEGLRAADATLVAYQRDLDRAVTRRLHAYLPLTSLGVPVEFRTRTPGDERFAGLTGLRPGDARLTAMRDGIRELVATTFARVVGGADDEEVYGLWRDLTRERVTEARARFEAPVADTPTTIDLAETVATIRAGSRRFGPHDAIDRDTVTDIVLSFDQNVTLPAAVLLESIVANASGSLRLWVLNRGLPRAYPGWLAAAFPSVPMTFLPCDNLAYGPSGRPRRVTSRITISTMDRLIVPDLLDGVARVVYLDVDTLMLDDICQLARTDLAGRPVAARDSNVSETSEWVRAGRRLKEDLAMELRRRMGLRHGYGHAALNAGVLVMDLERMRRDGFTVAYLGLVERYGLHDQDTMLAYVGPDRAVLEPRWNALPTLEDVADPGLIHWASFGKPWEPQLTYEQNRWRGYAAQLHERAGAPPTDDDGRSGPPGSLKNPAEAGPVRAELSAELERVIHAVRREHLTYLDDDGLRTLAAAVERIEVEAIEGLIVEAGTARGGSAITMAAAKSPARRMKAYDMFGMIPPPGEKDGEDVHRRYATIASGSSKGIGGETYYGYRSDLLAEVTESFVRHGLPIEANNIELTEGLFDDTITLAEPVALAHLDGDWYASTMTCLTRIAPLLSVGGRLVIDDYDTWSGCRAAVDDYFSGRSGFRFERRGRLHVVRE
jgi:lipopolysaccharide biosynthesis glycosyltransferase